MHSVLAHQKSDQMFFVEFVCQHRRILSQTSPKTWTIDLLYMFHEWPIYSPAVPKGHPGCLNAGKPFCGRPDSLQELSALHQTLKPVGRGSLPLLENPTIPALGPSCLQLRSLPPQVPLF